MRLTFFGPPAANRNYETEIQTSAAYFGPKKYGSFDFSIVNQGMSFDKVTNEGSTDENGNAKQTFEVPALFANKGLLKTTFYATVFDETGRPVSRSASANIIHAESVLWYWQRRLLVLSAEPGGEIPSLRWIKKSAC